MHLLDWLYSDAGVDHIKKGGIIDLPAIIGVLSHTIRGRVDSLGEAQPSIDMYLTRTAGEVGKLERE